MASSRLLTLPINESDSILKRRRLDDRTKHVGQVSHLHSSLWEKLPESLLVEILAKLPFASLVRMCSVQKKWRDLILSSDVFPRCTSRHGRLLFYTGFYSNKLEVYSSSRGTRGRKWEKLAPQFLGQFGPLDMITSTAGILCFHTYNYADPGIMDFIVCNPMTKCYKTLQMLYAKESAISDESWMLIAASDNPYPMFTSWIAGMVVDPDTGHFKLMAACIHPLSRGTTFVYDSGTDSWKTVAPVLDLNGILLNHYYRDQKLQAVVCGQKLYFYFLLEDGLLKYDVEHETWSWIVGLEYINMAFPRNIIEHNGKIIMVTSHDNIFRFKFRIQMTFQAFELQDEGASLWLPISHPPFSTISELVPDMRGIECFGQGEVVFLVRKNARVDAGFVFALDNTASKGTVREFRRNSNNSYVDSSWEVYSEEYDGCERFPLCHICTPSTLLLK